MFTSSSTTRRVLRTLLPFLFLVCISERRGEAQPVDSATPAQPSPVQSTPVEPPGESLPAEPLQPPGQEELPLLKDLPWPETKTLLQAEPRDWVLLIGGRVLSIPPLWPRPDYVEWLQNEQKKLSSRRPTDPIELQKWLEEYRRFNFLRVEVEEDSLEEDYVLPVRFIDRILYHEDLMLNRAQESISQGQLEEAHRLISAATQRMFQYQQRRIAEQLPLKDWPGLREAERAFFLAEVRQAKEQKLWEKAFQHLLLYAENDPTYDQIPLLLGTILDGWAVELLQQKQHRELRYAIDRVRALFPEHPQALEWTNRLSAEAQQMMQAAEAAFQQADDRTAALLGLNSVQIWPHASDLRRRWQPLQQRYPVLRVGLLADEEHVAEYRQQLLQQRWFHIESIKEGYPRYGSRFIETWRPDDLGRTLTFTLRSGRQPFESQPVLSSDDLSADLWRAAAATTPQAQGILAGNLRQWERHSPTELQLQLHTPTASPLAWFAAMMQHAPPAEKNPLSHSPFQIAPDLPDKEQILPTQRAVRAQVYPAQLSRIPLSEVQDFVYGSPRKLLQGLLRDELDYVPYLPAEYVQKLQEDRRFLIQRYQVPRLTALQFHWRGALAAHPELRLALCTLLDRQEMLNQLAPAESSAQEFYQLTSSLTPRGSHAWQNNSELPGHDPVAGLALYAVIGRQFNGKTLRLAMAEGSEQQVLAEWIQQAWERLGLKIEVVPAKTSADDETEDTPPWDVRLVSYQMLAPLAELPALLTVSGRVSQRDLQQLPVSVRQPMLRLEEAHSWQQVNRALSDLQQRLIAENWMFPLWEKQEYGAIRREVQHVPQDVLRPCQQIDRWTISPVIPSF